MRGKLLHLLIQSSNTFISGQQISEELGISRTAVWKHIEELRKNGYELEAVPRKGYRLLSFPDLASEDEIKSRLSTKVLGKNIVYKKEVSSTQEIAHDMARKEAPEGTIIVSDEQTKGKGRLGREWYSPAGDGLWFSLILRPDIPPHKAPQLTLLTAVAVAEGIKQATGIQVQIKWPNDLLIHGKKTAGILTELQSEPDRVQAVIVGIGLNVNQEYFPDDLSKIATSLAIEGGEAPYYRADIVASILERFETWYDLFLKEGFDQVRKRWEQLAITIGQKITAKTVTKTWTGIAEGITEDGILLLRKENGEVEHIYSADIE